MEWSMVLIDCYLPAKRLAVLQAIFYPLLVGGGFVLPFNKAQNFKPPANFFGRQWPIARHCLGWLQWQYLGKQLIKIIVN